MRELQVGISYEDECFYVGYYTEKGLTDHVHIPFTEITPVLSELLSFLEPALKDQAGYIEALAKEVDMPKRSITINGKAYVPGYVSLGSYPASTPDGDEL